VTDFARTADERTAVGSGAKTAGSGSIGPITIRPAPVVVVAEQDRVPLVLTIVEPIEIGRDCRGLNLLDASISRRHLALHPSANRLYISDLSSRNGSTIDGRPLTRRQRLRVGEIVRFGACTLALVGERPCPLSPAGHITASPDDPPATTVRRLARDILARVRNWPPDDTGTVTVVVTAITCPTTSSRKLRDVEWHEALAVHNRILRAMLARHRGSEAYPFGVGSIACFSSAHSALRFVVDVQRATAAYEESNPTAALRYRTGVHGGETVVGDSGSQFGMYVGLAAAIADEARTGEILVSSVVREIVNPCSDFRFRARAVTLHGREGMHLLHAVVT